MRAEIEKAAEALRLGELVLMPTETVYGLAARADDPEAVARIYAAKGRPRFNPLIAHVDSLATAEKIAQFDARARALAEAFWPGPLTLVLPIRDREGVCDLARAGLDSVAIRVPGHPVALDLIGAFGGAVVAPSANRSGRPSPTRLKDALEETGAFVAVGLEGGQARVGLESSVISLIGDARLLRPGFVTRAEIEALIGALAEDEAEGHRSPGRLSLHYAPDAPLTINIDMPEPGAAYLAFGPTSYEGPVFQLSHEQNLAEAAANLFGHLRAADQLKPPKICVASVPDHGLGEAINDRLKRAAGFVG
jgi:L-threonylcarbamoyladenylate synthase